jgi:hypothetical protein
MAKISEMMRKMNKVVNEVGHIYDMMWLGKITKDNLTHEQREIIYTAFETLPVMKYNTQEFRFLPDDRKWLEGQTWFFATTAHPCRLGTFEIKEDGTPDVEPHLFRGMVFHFWDVDGKRHDFTNFDSYYRVVNQLPPRPGDAEREIEELTQEKDDLYELMEREQLEADELDALRRRIEEAESRIYELSTPEPLDEEEYLKALHEEIETLEEEREQRRKAREKSKEARLVEAATA